MYENLSHLENNEGTGNPELSRREGGSFRRFGRSGTEMGRFSLVPVKNRRGG